MPADSRVVDIDGLKGRLAEALVESIFHRAGYTVSRLGRESQVQRLVKIGADEFAPDFLVWRPERNEAAPDRHAMLTVEVKYRANLSEFLRRYAPELFAKARTAWPGLYFVLVTDNPAQGRSCFQSVALRDYEGAGVPTALDLHELAELDIYRTNVVEHEAVARALFSTLARRRRPTRRAPVSSRRMVNDLP